MSGAYRSTTRMALDFAGMDDIRYSEKRRDKQSEPAVNLYLPESVTMGLAYQVAFFYMLTLLTGGITWRVFILLVREVHFTLPWR